MKIKICRTRPGAIIPTKAYPSDAAWDLYAPHSIELYPGQTLMIDTGIVIELPPSYVGLIQLRSSIGKSGICMPNAPGIIDPSYRGSIKFILHNLAPDYRIFYSGDRIAQLMILKLPPIDLIEGEVNFNTERGGNGVGSTGR